MKIHFALKEEEEKKRSRFFFFFLCSTINMKPTNRERERETRSTVKSEWVSSSFLVSLARRRRRRRRIDRDSTKVAV